VTSRPDLLAVLLVAACFASALPAHAEGPADQGYRKLSAREIRAFFTGKIFSDGTHFSNRYEADGKIDGFAMGKKVSNTVSGGGKDVLTGAVVLTAREPQRFLRAALDTPPFKKS
jgi:hypothetical protein